VEPSRVETNIVIVDVASAGWTPAEFVAQAARRGIRLYPVSTTSVRLVWHLDVDEAGTDRAIEALVPLLQGSAQTS
jgi:threonine aldolase